MPHQRFQRLEPAPRQIADLGLAQQRRRPPPVGAERGAVRPVERQRIDLQHMRQRQRGIAPAAQRVTLRGRSPVRRPGRRKPAQIVERDLRRRKLRKLRAGLPVEITQQPVAEPVVPERAQLLLDALERTPERRPTRHRLRQIDPAGIEPHRIKAGEPPDRAREIDIGKNLLPPMPLQIDQHRLADAPAAPPAPLRQRNRQRGQQHVVDAAMERRRHPRQQRARRPATAASASDGRPCRLCRVQDRACHRPARHEGALSIPRQNDSSATRSASCACASSRCAQCRNDVPRAASAGASPRAIASQAAAISGTRIRHDTPSTDR